MRKHYVPEFVTPGEDLFKELDFAAHSFQLRVFKWDTLVQYICRQNKKYSLEEDYSEQEIMPIRSFLCDDTIVYYPRNDYYVGIFGDATYSWLSCFHQEHSEGVKMSFESHCPTESVSDHEVYGIGSLVAGKHTREWWLERYRSNGTLARKSESEIEKLLYPSNRRSNVGDFILVDYLAYHVPAPNTKRNAMALARVIGDKVYNYYVDLEKSNK